MQRRLSLAGTTGVLDGIQAAAVPVRRRRLRLLPWVVLWVPFELLKRFFLLEALLAYRMRPVKPPLPVRARYPTWRSMLTPWRPPAAENVGA